MDNAVVGALKERGVNGADGVESHRSHATGEQDRVLFGDPDIVISIWHCALEQLEACAAGHSRSDANDRIVLLAEPDHRLAENILPIRRRPRICGQGCAGDDVVRSEAVEFFRIFESGLITLSLLGQNVNHDRMVAGFGELQRADQQGEIVPINRAKIPDAHLLEDQTAAIAAATIRLQNALAGLPPDFGQGTFEPFLRLVGKLQCQFALGQTPDEPFEIPSQFVIGRMGNELVKIAGDGADIFGNAPFIIVKNADKLLGRVGDIVQRFKRNPVGQSRIAENGDDVLIGAALVPRGADPERRGQSRAGMRGAIAIVLTLRTQGKTADTAGATNGMELVPAARQELVNVNLMTYIPKEFVAGRAKNVVQSERQFHDTEVRPKMAAAP